MCFRGVQNLSKLGNCADSIDFLAKKTYHTHSCEHFCHRLQRQRKLPKETGESMKMIKAEGLTYEYTKIMETDHGTEEHKVAALKSVNIEIEKGEFCVIVGASGAGKTTILNILGGMDTLTDGAVYLDGEEISAYNKKQLTGYRRHDVGFVFQFYNLVPNLTALENVELAAQICKNPLDAMEVLKDVGLDHRLANFPAQLSGGEQQRVAIARALAKNPKILLCDEPTGALDYQTGKAVLKLLQDTCREKGKTVIVITHNQALTAMADRVITVKNGTITKMIKNEVVADIADIEW